jgi:type VI secretion system secreted protein Hcp
MADVRYVLQLGDLEGESTLEGHEGAIEVRSFAWGLSHPTSGGGAGGGAGTGKVDVDDLTFVATTSIASPNLMLACAQGTHFPEAVLTGLRKAKGKGKDQFLVIRLTDVLVDSYAIVGTDGGVPEDEVTLTFSTVMFEVSNGQKVVQAGWDIAANAAL